MCQFFFNPDRQPEPQWDDTTRDLFEADDIVPLHSSLEEYQPTPLVSLPALAKHLHLRRILIKDESHRFGLKAFKALGSSYAIYRVLSERLQAEGKQPPAAGDFYAVSDLIEKGRYTFCTATDGNHGRGVAWTARKLGQKAVIYMPEGTVPARIANIESEGAEVIVVDGDYDEAVRQAAEDSAENGWQIISDTSWPGYEQIPRWIMAGYMTMFYEIGEAFEDDIDVVFVQAGVGALAGAAAYYFNRKARWPGPKIISLEPTSAACVMGSMQTEERQPITLSLPQDSIMAGLNCATPSIVCWPLVRYGFDMFMTLSDAHARWAMTTYHRPYGDDPQIISGESGAAGLGALLALCELDKASEAREKLRLGEGSTVLLLNTEGDTDPVSYRRICRIND